MKGSASVLMVAGAFVAGGVGGSLVVLSLGWAAPGRTAASHVPSASGRSAEAGPLEVPLGAGSAHSQGKHSNRAPASLPTTEEVARWIAAIEAARLRTAEEDSFDTTTAPKAVGRSASDILAALEAAYLRRSHQEAQPLAPPGKGPTMHGGAAERQPSLPGSSEGPEPNWPHTRTAEPDEAVTVNQYDVTVSQPTVLVASPQTIDRPAEASPEPAEPSAPVFQPVPTYRFSATGAGRGTPGRHPSAHGRSPFGRTDYSYHHDPWSSARRQ